MTRIWAWFLSSLAWISLASMFLWIGWSAWQFTSTGLLFLMAGALHRYDARKREQAEQYRRMLRARAHAGLDGGTHDAQGDVSGMGTWA